MNDNILDLIKEKPIVIPRILLRQYKSLGITDEELILIIAVMSYGDMTIYNALLFAKQIGATKHTVMKNINSLCDKNILSIVVSKKDNKAYEYVSLEPLYSKLYNAVIDNEKTEVKINEGVFEIFESELGRTLSPMEYEKIKEWITSGNSEEMIVCALRESVMNGVNNFNYIDSILNNWKKKGYKNKNDILKDKEMYRNKKDKVEVFDTDWLNE